MPDKPDKPEKPHLHWNSRGYLPHFDQPGMIQAITCHLGDSLPQTVLASMEVELAGLSESERDIERRQRIEAWLDAGHGECWLGRPDLAAIVETALRHFDGGRYRLIAWVIMPNHIHFIAKMAEGHPLGDVMYSLKSYTAKAANKLLARSGRFWARDYFDRFIRDEAHFLSAVRYVERNPVKARLCQSPEDWPWSSARKNPGPPPSPCGL